MLDHNPENERLKRDYFAWLREAQGQSPASLASVAAALHRFEKYTRFKPFRSFRRQQAIGFKAHLNTQLNARTKDRLSKSTLLTTTAVLKKFFQWLAMQPGYRAHIRASDADYFNLLEKDVSIARARRQPRHPTLEQIRRVLASMPTETELHLRNRALVAFAILTGARDLAIASMRLRHVDAIEGVVYQDAREVKTKFSKTFDTIFFPVGDDIRAIVREWIDHLRISKGWTDDDPVFPRTRIEQGASRYFTAAGVDRVHWSNTEAIRKIFRQAFTSAGLPYANPHSFRNTLVELGQRLCRSPEEYKSWSQNLGHSKVLTTLTSYGEVSRQRQAEIIAALGSTALKA